MRGISSIVAVAAMAACAVAFGPSATAQEDVTPKFKLAPNVLLIEQHFEVQIEDGTCPGGTDSVSSPGFVAPLEAGSLHGIAAAKPGKHTATLKCKGTSNAGTAEFEITNLNIRPTFKIEPSALQSGQHFEVQIKEGDCPGGGTVSSPGFKETVPVGNLHGVAGGAPGKYVARLRCKAHAIDGVAQFEILAQPPTKRFNLGKAEYAPGEPVTATYPVSANCIGDLTSTGFVAPIKFSQEADSWHGTGKAVDATGYYVASMTCDNITVKQGFVIKPPIVKPKGAPETGGGGTA